MKENMFGMIRGPFVVESPADAGGGGVSAEPKKKKEKQKYKFIGRNPFTLKPYFEKEKKSKKKKASVEETPPENFPDIKGEDWQLPFDDLLSGSGLGDSGNS